MKRILFLTLIYFFTYGQSKIETPVSVFVEAGKSFFSPPVKLTELLQANYNEGSPFFKKLDTYIENDFRFGLNLQFSNIEADVSFSFTNGSAYTVYDDYSCIGDCPKWSKFIYYTQRLNTSVFYSKKLHKNYFVRGGGGVSFITSANVEQIDVNFIGTTHIYYKDVKLTTQQLGDANAFASISIGKKFQNGYTLQLNYSREIFKWNFSLITNVVSIRLSKKIF